MFPAAPHTPRTPSGGDAPQPSSSGFPEPAGFRARAAAHLSLFVVCVAGIIFAALVIRVGGIIRHQLRFDPLSFEGKPSILRHGPVLNGAVGSKVVLQIDAQPDSR